MDAREWNNPKKQSLPLKGVSAVTSAGVSKLHHKIHESKHENVGVKAAHNAELVGESAYRGGKTTAQSAYRFHKNTPYRRVSKLEQKTLKTNAKLNYQKAVRDNSGSKSNAVSKFMQKRKIKRQYAAALRKAKKSGQTLKTTGNILNKAGQVVTNIVRKNPVLLLKIGLLLLIVFVIMSMVTMCVSLFSGGSGIFGAVSYSADYEDIDASSVLYTELETDLRVYIDEIELNYPAFDEYRYNVGAIGHNPFD